MKTLMIVWFVSGASVAGIVDPEVCASTRKALDENRPVVIRLGSRSARIVDVECIAPDIQARL